ncbi:MAG TPA: hypothetical protein VKA66_16800 [Mycobacterium sp.]|nr:hypothetical protein [Mycobacterium sp.]
MTLTIRQRIPQEDLWSLVCEQVRREFVGMTWNLPTPGEPAAEAADVFASRYQGDFIRTTADDD